MEIPRLTLGTWVFAGDALWGPQDLAESISTIHASIEHGLNLFDSAPGYGNGKSEEVLGLALEDRRDQALIATKVSRENVTREGIRTSCEESLKRLRTDYIDLLQIHWPNYEVPFEEVIEPFSKLKEEGKIRAIGVCNFGKPDVEEWFALGGEMVSNQLPYSILTRSIEFEIVPACARHGVAVLPYSPLMQGLLTGKFKNADEVPEGRARSRHFRADRPVARHGEPGCEELTFATIDRLRNIAAREGIPMGQLSLAWLLAQETVGSTIVGARSTEQLEDNIASLDHILSKGLIEEMSAATDEVKEYLGTNPDIWQVPSRIRHS